MIPKRERLTKKLFAEVFKKGKKAQLPSFLAVSMNNVKPGLHFSAVVSKKNAPKAVLRNKIRRRVYSALRSLEYLLSSKNIAVILICRKGIEKQKYEDLHTEIERYLNTLSN